MLRRLQSQLKPLYLQPHTRLNQFAGFNRLSHTTFFWHWGDVQTYGFQLPYRQQGRPLQELQLHDTKGQQRKVAMAFGPCIRPHSLHRRIQRAARNIGKQLGKTYHTGLHISRNKNKDDREEMPRNFPRGIWELRRFVTLPTIRTEEKRKQINKIMQLCICYFYSISILSL